MKRKLAYIFVSPLLLFVLGFQGTCRSQCEELRRVLIAECRDDLGADNERCREDQKKFQEVCQQDLESEAASY